MTEVLSKDDWLKLIDYLFTYREDPELLIYFCAAFLICSKGALMQISTVEEMFNFQSRNTGIAFKKITTLAFKMHANYKADIFTGNVNNALPL